MAPWVEMVCISRTPHHQPTLISWSWKTWKLYDTMQYNIVRYVSHLLQHLIVWFPCCSILWMVTYAAASHMHQVINKNIDLYISSVSVSRYYLGIHFQNQVSPALTRANVILPHSISFGVIIYPCHRRQLFAPKSSYNSTDLPQILIFQMFHLLTNNFSS